MVSSEITSRFNAKLNVSICKFADKYQHPKEQIKILLSPIMSVANTLALEYSVYSKGVKLCNVTFTDVVKLDKFESFAINEKKITEFITVSIRKFAIGAGCHATNLGVMIFLKDGVQLALLNKTTNTYISYFQVNELF